MEEDDEALAFMAGGDQRRAIGEAGPDLARKIGIGLGQNLAGDAHCRVGGKAGEGTGLGENLQVLGRFPTQGAAQRTAAFTQ